jgi:hypothetical protein
MAHGEAFSSQHSAVSENQNQHQHQKQNQRPFTTEGTEDTEESKTLPLMNADDTDRKSTPRMDADERGLGGARGPVEWKPTPDMYRMDTREGREAYEASFGTKIKPRVAGESMPLEAVVAPEDRSETYAIRG